MDGVTTFSAIDTTLASMALVFAMNTLYLALSPDAPKPLAVMNAICLSGIVYLWGILA